MPHLVSWARQYGSQGLLIIGNHVQKGSKSEIEALCRRNRVNYTITTGARVSGDTARGIPRMYLFDHKGLLAWEGHPASALSVVKDTLAKAPPPVLAGVKIRKLKKFSDALKKGYPPGKVLKKAQSKVSSPDEETAREAKEIVEKLLDHAKKLREKAEKLVQDDPYRSCLLLEKLKKEFAGTDPGSKAGKRLRELKKDKVFAAGCAAGKLLAAIKTYGEKLKPVGRQPVDLSDSSCFKLNRSTVKRMVSYFRILKKKHGDTRYYRDAEEYLKGLGLNV